jgi:acetyl esterase/lipase
MSTVLASSHANLPPTFFQICGLDPLRDDAFLYDRLLREAGCKTYTKACVQFQQTSPHRALLALTNLASSSYPGLPHGFAWEYPKLQSSEQYQLDVRTGLRWLLHQVGAPS